MAPQRSHALLFSATEKFFSKTLDFSFLICYTVLCQIPKDLPWFGFAAFCGQQTDEAADDPIYRCAGPVQQNTVNHVRRGTEQH